MTVSIKCKTVFANINRYKWMRGHEKLKLWSTVYKLACILENENFTCRQN